MGRNMGYIEKSLAIDFVMSVPPKSWNKLEGKPAHEIVRSVCLASYSMLMRT